jgi:2-polyprenyl-6-methoxyphenol hydroxylase and related FAD-dependent oxidoreductases
MGGKVQADVLVGADGVHSAVRAQLFGPAALRYRGYTAVRSITPAGSVPLPRDGIETWGRGARFGLGPTSGDRVIWYAMWNAPAGDTMPVTPQRGCASFSAAGTSRYPPSSMPPQRPR